MLMRIFELTQKFLGVEEEKIFKIINAYIQYKRTNKSNVNTV